MDGEGKLLDWFKKLFLSSVQHLSSPPVVILSVDQERKE